MIITFHISLSLFIFSASVTHPTFSHFLSRSNIFSCCFPLLQSFQLSQDILVSLFSSCVQKRLPGVLHILFMSDLVLLASHITGLNDFFAVHEFCIFLCMNHISVVPSFFDNCFEIVQALHPYTRMGSILHSRALLLITLKANFLPEKCFM